jgi:signal transduction histidine kinase
MTREGALGRAGRRLRGVATEGLRVETHEQKLERRPRQRQALEINDNIVQGLTVAKYAMDAQDTARAKEAVERTLKAARKIVTDLLNEDEVDYLHLGPGDLVRIEPATVVIAEED